MTANNQNMSGMGAITDQVIATDLMLAVKSGIINYAIAISEAATPEVRETLRRQLNTAIDTHGKITDYMVSMGYYFPGDVFQQIAVDLQASQTALNLQQQQQNSQQQNSQQQNSQQQNSQQQNSQQQNSQQQNSQQQNSQQQNSQQQNSQQQNSQQQNSQQQNSQQQNSNQQNMQQ
ncbi:spore coat protein [Lysinibacillus yapensis]|uniref:Spore coat protein n=1 Tax=Ureibacillus yapensis TaxID=2304605 RepID=A0A396SM22_9BACL|nr:spore coat protein [Lysinibacillus yapensis]RHW40097.1 spore coat protein [Lysinibacillus yapensis]